MDIRKIIKFGSSSYVVSLPKNWVNKNKLGKGDLLYFNENGNNELVISPRDNERKKELSRITIDVGNKPKETIRREIMAAYISNHDIIKITGDLKPLRPDVDGVLHQLLALEIMEDTPEKLVIKDFLNVEDISLNEIIRRMDVMVRSMLNDVDASFSRNMYEKINQLDQSVNKLMFLVFRVVRKGMKDNSVLKSLKVRSSIDLLDYWLIVDNLERIADEAKRVTRFLKRAELSKEEIEDFKKLFGKTREGYLHIMKAFYSRDINAAHMLATDVNERLEKWDELFYKSNTKIAGPLIERFKAICGQMRSLARVIIHRGVDSEAATLQTD